MATLPTTKEVYDAMCSLGYMGSKVAEKLITQGFKGDPGKCNTCPIANWLTKLFPLEEGLYWRVTMYDVEINRCDNHQCEARYPNTQGVIEFISDLDFSGAHGSALARMFM